MKKKKGEEEKKKKWAQTKPGRVVVCVVWCVVCVFVCGVCLWAAANDWQVNISDEEQRNYSCKLLI